MYNQTTNGTVLSGAHKGSWRGLTEVQAGAAAGGAEPRNVCQDTGGAEGAAETSRQPGGGRASHAQQLPGQSSP